MILSSAEHLHTHTRTVTLKQNIRDFDSKVTYTVKLEQMEIHRLFVLEGTVNL